MLQLESFPKAPARTLVALFHRAGSPQNPRPLDDATVSAFASSKQKTRAWNVVDPGDQLGRYFYDGACPLNVVLDARTMEILVAQTGYSSEFPAQVELLRQQLLARPPSY